VAARHQHDQGEPGLREEHQHRLGRIHPPEAGPADDHAGQDLADRDREAAPVRGGQQRADQTDGQDQGQNGQAHLLLLRRGAADVSPELMMPGGVERGERPCRSEADAA
jgi:hypothetical protein